MSQKQSTLPHMPYPPPRLKTLPLCERPTSRIINYGAGAVSQIELLASLIGGSRQLEIADEVVRRFGTIREIVKASITELATIKGMGQGKAARLKAALELGRRLMTTPVDSRPQIASPADAANLLLLEMGSLEKEQVRVIVLDTRNRVIEISTIYVGSLNTSVVRVAELFRPAIKLNAAAVIVVHNHPSGDKSPSPQDIQLTKMLVEAGKLLDIEVLDHLIIGGQSFVSLKERGLGFG